MQLDNFTEQCQKLMAWFNKTLTNEQMIQLYRKVSYIPTEPFNAVVEHILDDFKPTPGNFPTIKQIKELYQVWKFENPKKYLATTKTPCDECKESGFIWVRVRKQENYFKELCFRCGSCENWKSEVSAETLPSITIEQAQEKGLEVIFT